MPQAYVWSDQHFYHLNIIHYTKRPFSADAQGMQDACELMLNNCRSIVKSDDVLLFLGDVAWVRSEFRPALQKLFGQMPGHKILLKGNHDSASDTFYHSLGFEQILPYLVCNEYFFCHYPLQAIPDSRHEAAAAEAFAASGCTRIIHGHTHNQTPDINDGIPRWNVCVDYGSNNYRPLLITDSRLSDSIIERLGHPSGLLLPDE